MESAHLESQWGGAGVLDGERLGHFDGKWPWEDALMN